MPALLVPRLWQRLTICHCSLPLGGHEGAQHQQSLATVKYGPFSLNQFAGRSVHSPSALWLHVARVLKWTQQGQHFSVVAQALLGCASLGRLRGRSLEGVAGAHPGHLCVVGAPQTGCVLT